MKSYCEWYSCDNFIRDTAPQITSDGHPATGAGWLALLNPDAAAPAQATITVYSSVGDQQPRSFEVLVPPARMELVELHNRPEVPRNAFFGLGVAADRPLIAQATQYEFRPFECQPDATLSKVLYPGPLDELEWYFPDGWQGGEPGSRKPWYERETLTILNPGEREARVRLTFFSYRQAADLELWVPPRQLRALPLWDMPGLRFRWVEDQQTRMIDFSLRVTSDVPVVTQKTRRAYVQWEESVQGMWTSFGHPYPLAARQDAERRVWYYPGGYVQDVGAYPRDTPETPPWNMLTGWDLFFTFNPDTQRCAHCTATFHQPAEAPQSYAFDVEPQQQTLHWLHDFKNRHLTGVNQPYAVTVESDGPLVPHFLRAEYQAWSACNPTAMYGIIPYEGPLSDETEWLFAEGFWQDREDHPWVEQEWIAVFNPGAVDADITTTFYTGDGPRDYQAAVAAGSVTVLRMEEIGVVSSGSHYGVKIAGTQPIVVQQSRRTFVKGGPPTTVSTTATLAIPFKPTST